MNYHYNYNTFSARFYNKKKNLLGTVKCLDFEKKLVRVCYNFHRELAVNGEYLMEEARIDDGILLQYTGMESEDLKPIYDFDVVEYEGDNYLVITNFPFQPTVTHVNDVRCKTSRKREYFLENKRFKLLGSSELNPELLNKQEENVRLFLSSLDLAEDYIAKFNNLKREYEKLEKKYEELI